MYQKLYSPNVLATSSSLVGEDSLSHHVDRSIGVYIIDRYTYYTLEFLERQVQPTTNKTMREYLDSCPKNKCMSTVGVRVDQDPAATERVRVTDFFGAVRHVRTLTDRVELPEDWTSDSASIVGQQTGHSSQNFVYISPLPF